MATEQNQFVNLRVRGTYDDPTHHAHRILLCRRWVLANCIGAGAKAPASACRAAIDFLVRGDDVSSDLDWRTEFVP